MTNRKKPRIRRRPIAIAAAGAVLAMVLAPVADGQGGPPGRPATPVRVGKVELRELQQRRKVTGELRAVARSSVATIEPGLVRELPIEEGQLVRAGDLLAVLDSRRLDIELTRLKAQMDVAEATVAVRQAELQRDERDLAALKAMAELRASNPKELADAESAVAIAQSRKIEAERDVDVLTAQIGLVQTQLNDMHITAPFDGVVIARHTERGQWLGQGDAIAEIVSVDAYDAWLDVPQSYARSVVGTGAKVQVHVEAAGYSAPPLAPRVVPLVDPSARTFPVYVRLENSDGVLAPGMSVTGWVPTGERRQYLTLPRDALLRNEAGFYVFAARPGQGGAFSAVPAQVVVLFEADNRVAVQAPDLADGDLVVVEGNERLFPMTPISIDAAPAGTPDGSMRHEASPGTAAGADQKGP